MRTPALLIPSLALLLATACCDKNDEQKKKERLCEGCCIGVAGELYTTGIIKPDSEYQQSDLVVNPLAVTYAPEGAGYLYDMTAEVTNNLNDDCSKCSRITVLLPIESDIRSFSATTNKDVPLTWTQCKQVPAEDWFTAGMITVEVPDYICQAGPEVKDITAIQIKCSAFCALDSSHQLATSFAVFAGSSVPDPDLSNNYAYWNRAEHDAASASPAPMP